MKQPIIDLKQSYCYQNAVRSKTSRPPQTRRSLNFFPVFSFVSSNFSAKNLRKANENKGGKNLPSQKESVLFWGRKVLMWVCAMRMRQKCEFKFVIYLYISIDVVKFGVFIYFLFIPSLGSDTNKTKPMYKS